MEWFLNWLPRIFLWSIFFVTAASYFSQRFSLRKLIFLTVLFYLFYASLLTVLQYHTWAQNDFTKLLLGLPVDREALQPILGNFFWLFDHKLGYFLLYAWGRFWFEAFLSIFVAGFFYLFLHAVSLLKKEFFKPGEKELAFLGGLLVGWPNFVVFVPLAFSFMVGLSIVRRVYLKEYTTTMYVPFLIATFLTLLLGDQLISILHLTTLKV